MCRKPYREFESHSLRHTGRKVLNFQRFVKIAVWQPISWPILPITRVTSLFLRPNAMAGPCF